MYFLVFLSALVACAAGVPLNSTSSKVEGRILGGRLTIFTRVPYQVSLQVNRLHVCSGVIISATWVLTARDCIISDIDSTGLNFYPLEIITVRSGSPFYSCLGTIHQVGGIIPHDINTQGMTDPNIALVQVTTGFEFNGRVQKIELQRTEVPEETQAVVSGWGATRYRGPLSRFLRRLTVTIMNFDSCRRISSFQEEMPANLFCDGNISEGRGICKGDHGGPLVAGGKLVGIVSGGDLFGCGLRNHPGQYVNVFSVLHWIEENAI